jgi:hypothetical protein
LADIFREVDEDLRRDSAQQLWDKYGIYLIGLAVSIIAVTSIVVGWRAYQTSIAEDAAQAFIEADAEASVEGSDAAAIYAALAEEVPAGYAALANLRAAAELSEAGDIDAAIKAYELISGDSSVEPILRDLADIKAGTLLVGRTSYDDLAGRLLPLTGEGEAWRNPAREILGLGAYREQKYAQARALFQEIVDDATATPGLRDRAHVLIALIDPHVTSVEPSPAAEALVEDAVTEQDATSQEASEETE